MLIFIFCRGQWSKRTNRDLIRVTEGYRIINSTFFSPLLAYLASFERSTNISRVPSTSKPITTFSPRSVDGLGLEFRSIITIKIFIVSLSHWNICQKICPVFGRWFIQNFCFIFNLSVRKIKVAYIFSCDWSWLDIRSFCLHLIYQQHQWFFWNDPWEDCVIILHNKDSQEEHEKKRVLCQWLRQRSFFIAFVHICQCAWILVGSLASSDS